MVDLDPPWVQVLPTNPIQKIFRRGQIGAQLRLLAVLEGEWTPELEEVRKQLRMVAYDSKPVKQIQRAQNRDGSWPVPASGQPVGAARQLELIGLLENLHALAVLGGHRSWPGVRRGIRAMLAHQHADGRFPLLYHHHAAIGGLLISLGLVRNPAVHRAAHWIAERQREDGGWLHPHMAGNRKSPPSCIWTTAEVLDFLTRYATFKIKAGLQAAGEFLLKHALEPNTTTLLPDPQAWDTLDIGSKGVQLFQGGTLRVLEGLTRAGFNPSDSTFKKLYSWLLEQQLGNGYFPRVTGRDTEGDALVTVRALQVIRRVETTRPGHPSAKTSGV